MNKKAIQDIKKAEKITFAGCGTGPNGEKVFNGYTIDGVPCEVVKLQVYQVSEIIVDLETTY